MTSHIDVIRCTEMVRGRTRFWVTLIEWSRKTYECRSVIQAAGVQTKSIKRYPQGVRQMSKGWRRRAVTRAANVYITQVLTHAGRSTNTYEVPRVVKFTPPTGWHEYNMVIRIARGGAVAVTSDGTREFASVEDAERFMRDLGMTPSHRPECGGTWHATSSVGSRGIVALRWSMVSDDDEPTSRSKWKASRCVGRGD